MGKETYRIEEYWHDEVTAFGTAFGILGERETPKDDFCESTDFNNLELSLIHISEPTRRYAISYAVF